MTVPHADDLVWNQLRTLKRWMSKAFENSNHNQKSFNTVRNWSFIEFSIVGLTDQACER